MSKTALNLFAILVFVMTLSTLLGLMLTISPYLPAIATFSLLGLATVDTLTWQGYLEVNINCLVVQAPK